MPAPVACCLPRWPVACSNAPFPLFCCLPRWPVACPGGLLPAPMACCLLRWPVACSNAPFPLLCCLPRWPVACPDAGLRLPRCGRGWLRRPDGGLSCEVRWLGPGLGQFCRRSRALEGAVLHADQRELPVGHPPVGLVYGQFCMLFVTTVRPSTRPSGWCSGCFACGVGLSKAYRHFASVIALTKCGGAGKAEPLCRAAPQPPTRILVSL